MDKTVSVIIPTYKTDESLERAIQSVEKQSYKNIEIIVVSDNDSKSKWHKKAAEITSRHKNVKLISYGKNINGSFARNKGYEESKGELIAFLDDDDYYFENKISQQVEALERGDFDMCTCYYIDSNDNKYEYRTTKDLLEDIFMCKKTPQTSSFLIKRDFFEQIGGFDSTYIRHQDYEFMIRAIDQGKVVHLSKYLYKRTKGATNNIPNPEKMEAIKDKFLDDFKHIIKKYHLNHNKIEASNYSYVLTAYLKNKQVKNAIRVYINHCSPLLTLYVFKIIYNTLKKNLNS